jgi:hypothetical protein
MKRIFERVAVIILSIIGAVSVTAGVILAAACLLPIVALACFGALVKSPPNLK